MKRRKAIGRLLLAGGATGVAYGGYEWFELTKKPDIPYLQSKKQLLAGLAEAILPATDTPGAIGVGAVDFMIPMLTQCTDTKTLNHFIEGLQDLEAHTRSRYNLDFTDCSNKEKEETLQYFEEKSRPANKLLAKVKNKILGSSFFDTLKRYTVEAYCISEKGATLALRYVPVPGKYMGCIPLEPNQKAWATH